MDHHVLSTIRFHKNKRATPIPIPNINSRPPVSTRYFDLASDVPLSNQDYYAFDPSFTNSPNPVWNNELGLIDPRELRSHRSPIPTKPNLNLNPQQPVVIIKRHRCQDLPLSKTIPPRSKSNSNSLAHHSSARPPHKGIKPSELRPPKITVSDINKNLELSPPANRRRPLPRKRTIVTSSEPIPPLSKVPFLKKHASKDLDVRDCENSISSNLSDIHLSTRSPCSESLSTSAIGDASPAASFDILKDMQDTLSIRGISLQTKPLNYRINYHGDNDELADLVQPEDLSLENVDMIDDPESLCPFCDEPLPNKPSNNLVKLLQYLKSKPEVARRRESLNPLALYLPFSDTASCCQLHRAERKLIPDGIRKGWPTIIDFQALPNRIRNYRNYLYRVCTREVDSQFMQMALRQWQAQGPRKAQSVASDLETFQVEQPGYYGVQGYEVIYRALQHLFLNPTRIDSTTKSAKPLSPDFLIRKVLVPEAAICLISEDLTLQINHPKVLETLEGSRSFGTFMFPDRDDGINSSGDKSEPDEKDDEQIHPASNKRQKRKGLRKSMSGEIEILNGSKLSPDKDSTKAIECKVFPIIQTDQQDFNSTDIKRGHENLSTSRQFGPNNPASIRGKGKLKSQRYPTSSDGWQRTILP